MRAAGVSMMLLWLALAGCKSGGKKAVARAQGVAADAAGAAPVAPSVPPRPRGREIQVVIESKPSGAAVSIDGQLLGQTPLSHLTVGDGRQHVFSFRLAGHEDTRVSMLLLRDGVVTGVLKPLPAGADAGAP